MSPAKWQMHSLCEPRDSSGAALAIVDADMQAACVAVILGLFSGAEGSTCLQALRQWRVQQRERERQTILDARVRLEDEFNKPE